MRLNDQVQAPEADAATCVVLIVEDEALVRMVAVDLLESLGLVAVEASSAGEAVDRMGEAAPRIQVALIDIGLPDRRGDVLAGELRALDPDLLIIICSGYGQDVLQESLRDDKRVAFLPKPYGLEHLRDRLQTLGVATS